MDIDSAVGGGAVGGGAAFALCALCLCVAVQLWPSVGVGRAAHRFDASAWRDISTGRGRVAAGANHAGRFGAMVAATIGAALWVLVSWALGVAAGAIVGTVIHLVRRARAAVRRSCAMDDVITELRSLTRQWSAGHAVAEAVRRAMGRAAGRGQRTVAFVLSSLLSDAAYDSGAPAAGDGQELGEAWWRLAHVREVSARHGVPLAPLVAAVADDLDDRRAAARERATQAAGPALSGYVVAALPLAGIALGAGMGVNPVAVLCRTTVGHVLLVVGAVLLCAGLWWSERIVGR